MLGDAEQELFERAREIAQDHADDMDSTRREFTQYALDVFAESDHTMSDRDSWMDAAVALFSQAWAAEH